MKISPIKNTLSQPNFQGFYQTFWGSEDQLKKSQYWHKNSSIVKTQGEYNAYFQNKVYFASPMEHVTPDIKEKVDYVIYDNEPSYPEINDVKKNYLETNRKNYREDFEEVRNYYYRREMGGYAKVDEAKYQQWQAAECTRLYDKAGDLRYKKESTEDIVSKLETERKNHLTEIQVSGSRLETQEAIKSKVEKHIENLEKVQQPLKKLGKIAAVGIENEQLLYEEAENNKAKAAEYNIINNKKNKAFKLENTQKAVEKNTIELQETLDNFKSIKKLCEKNINDLNASIDKLKKELVNIEKDITTKKSFIEDCKSKLSPLFNELAEFYKKQGIKVIKRG